MPRVTVKNTFIEDLDDREHPRPAARSSSMPPSMDRALGVRRAAEADSDSEGPDSEHGATELRGSWARGAEQSLLSLSTYLVEKKPSPGQPPPGGGAEEQWDGFPGTDDEWEGATLLRGGPARDPPHDLVPRRCSAPCVAPAVLAPCPGGPDALPPRGRECAPPGTLPGAPAQARRRCRWCRGRLGDRCPCAARQAEAGLAPAGVAPSGACAPPAPPAAAPPRAPARPRRRAVAVRDVPADAQGAPGALAQATFRVRCPGGGAGIVVERLVPRTRLSSWAQEWAAHGAAAAPAVAAAPAGRTRLSSSALAWRPASAELAGAPAPRAATGAVTPRFGLALLQQVRAGLQKNVFVAGVTISAHAAGGWCVRLGVRGRHLFMRDHVLACAQEALLDALDALEALRARLPGGRGGGRGVPATLFDLVVEHAPSEEEEERKVEEDAGAPRLTVPRSVGGSWRIARRLARCIAPYGSATWHCCSFDARSFSDWICNSPSLAFWRGDFSPSCPRR
ncbi:unnamed protein product, partial [Prorocentrum cordatum]